MRNSYGHNITVTLSGESHGEALCVIIDGIKAGTPIRSDFIAHKLSLRRPSGKISTPRTEKDEFSIISGVFEGRATGSSITVIIPNTNTKSADYSKTRFIPRPSHADYVAAVKYGGYEDYRGGGHFSGRVTAALVVAGAIAEDMLALSGIKILTHISSLGGVSDRPFSDLSEDYLLVKDSQFPVLSQDAADKMKAKIEASSAEGDSIGGILETAIVGAPIGLGEPFFDSVESRLSHLLFSVPSVKGVEFGLGFGFGAAKGSEANDGFSVFGGRVTTKTNNNGGINGGLTNGMPIVFRTAIKPTPSISKPQESFDIRSLESMELEIKGRHDPCIVHRAAVVVSSCAALAIADLMSVYEAYRVEPKAILAGEL